jgi:protein gp37
MMAARSDLGTYGGVTCGIGRSSAEPGRAGSAPPEWYDVTWNPTVGCSPVSPGCDHCQALRTVSQLARIGGKGGARYAGLTAGGRSGLHWTGEIRVQTDLSTWPLFQRTSRRILVGSMSDLFHEQLPVETIDALHAVMAVAHWHRFLVLTKRAGRMRIYYADPQTPYRIAAAVDSLETTVLPSLGFRPRSSGDGGVPESATTRARSASVRQLWGVGLSRVMREPAESQRVGSSPIGLNSWPLPNLWPGVSVEDQERISRIGDLLQMPAALRWACFEPLLGPVRPDAVPIGDDDYVDALAGGRYRLDGRGRRLSIAGPAWRPLDWVVAGGEVGAGARPTDPDWVRRLRDRCVNAGVPFLFKEWGEWAPAPDGGFGRRMMRLGRRAAGRLVDGRSWNEMPAAMHRWSRRRR